MSDNNQDKPDDLDVVIDVEADTASEESYGEQPHEEAEPFRDVDADYTDIDDGESVDDSEDGIFAPDTVKKGGGKTAGLLSAVAVLAAVGAGGYVYYSNPDMIAQVKQNVLGKETESSIDSVAEIEGTDIQPAEEVLVAPTEEVSPIDDQNSVADVVDALPPEPSEPSEPAPDLMAAEMPVSEQVGETPDVDQAIKVEPEISKVAEAVVVSASENVAKNSIEDEKPIIVESKEVQAAMNDNAKLDQYFDSPSGRMLKEIPAPSMDASKGKNESIIVVNKQGKKSSQKFNHSNSVSFHSTDNDAKIVAASRALALQRYDAAKEMYDELYKINPRDGRVLMGRAVLFQKMGSVEDAIVSYEEVLRYYPDNAEAVVNLAGLIRKQYPAVALNKLLDLRQKYPDNAVVAAQLGVTYADSANYPDAFHYLSMAASMEPNNPQHLYNMAVVAERAGDAVKAIQNYEKALEVDAISGAGGKVISREKIYDRLTRLRGN